MKLQRKMQVMMMMFTLLSFSSCSQKQTETIYIKSPCPKLKVWEQNETIPTLKIDYKVIPDGFFLKEREFYAWAKYTKDLKKKFINSIELNKLYKMQNIEFNEKFKGIDDDI